MLRKNTKIKIIIRATFCCLRKEKKSEEIEKLEYPSLQRKIELIEALEKLENEKEKME